MKVPFSFTRARPRCGPDSSVRLEVAEKASSGTAPVLTPSNSAAKSKTNEQGEYTALFKLLPSF